MSRHTQAIANYKQHLIDRIGNIDPKLAAEIRGMSLEWYRISNKAEDNTDTTEVFIYDEIGGSFGVSADQFVKDLSEIDTPQIDLRINSPGGSLFDSIAIYNALVKHPAKVTTYVDAVAASGASIIAMAGDEVVMMLGSQLMIHDAIGAEIGNARDMSLMASFLDRQSNNIADIYAAHGGGTRLAWRERMLAETWMFADEAIDLGLADRTYSPPKDEEEEAEAELEDAEEIDVQVLMTRKHDLTNRDYKFAGRDSAPDPVTPKYSAVADALKNSLARKVKTNA